MLRASDLPRGEGNGGEKPGLSSASPSRAPRRLLCSPSSFGRAKYPKVGNLESLPRSRRGRGAESQPTAIEGFTREAPARVGMEEAGRVQAGICATGRELRCCAGLASSSPSTRPLPEGAFGTGSTCIRPSFALPLLLAVLWQKAGLGRVSKRKPARTSCSSFCFPRQERPELQQVLHA